MKETIKKIWVLFNRREKKKLILLFFMLIIAAIFETTGIGLIVPFVGIVTNPKMIKEQSILSNIYSLLDFQSTNAFVLFAVGVLLSVFIIKNAYLLVFYYLQYRVIYNQKVKLSSAMFREYLTKPYTFHLQRNSAELLRNINGEVPKVFDGILLASFQLLTEILVIISILSLLIVTAPIATFTSGLLLGGSVLLFFKIFRNKITFLGKESQRVSREVIKWVNQGLGASKEIKVSGKESYFVDSYSVQSRVMANNTIYKNMLDQVPRMFIETLLVSVVLITMIILVFQGTDTSKLVATMSLFAMAAFRLMPSIQRIVATLTTIRFSQPALTVVYNDLVKDNSGRSLIDKEVDYNSRTVKFLAGEKIFNNSIKLENVDFRYPNQEKYSIKNVSLTIPIGNSVAFVGTSGAGKTTIVDIILGLLEPEKGQVLVDGKNLIELMPLWQKKIGYIPQSIYLSDESIRKNVAFGINDKEIDEDAVQKAIVDAQLKDFVDSLPEGLDTVVGERGVRLSGGQRQRIGIARALYHNPEIIFLDEATSALDNDTEKEIMKSIDGLKGEKTLIIIAHRLSTIENCDIVFKVDKGRLISVDYKLKQTM
ncbi:ABC-type multidrug transport system fused ATPase/permease subunit [Neobacillus bataviensis]|uniref:ABC-type multidrug transport system fused ATPase/permease subunit n=1 Tax=Neobacillus bataviensis TaxID=220685 RepID=A0A561D634_9BACI|nr:ABC transporter ATP-binding protein [Neobacillus bataviensis]TWD98909.1 ABC-type multidrug transport system fused ATPase/permease subunit [Neobacillus bataviensis]